MEATQLTEDLFDLIKRIVPFIAAATAGELSDAPLLRVEQGLPEHRFHLDAAQQLQQSQLSQQQLPQRSQPQLPAELVLLHVLPLVPLNTRREMAFTCKRWHFLLLPNVVKEILAKRLGHCAAKSRFASLDDVVAFSRDLFRTSKLRLVDEVKVEHAYYSIPRKTEEETAWLIQSGLLEQCPSLRLLECAVALPESLLPRLAKLNSLRELEINLKGKWKLPEDSSFDCGSLEILRTDGVLSIDFLAGVAKGCPNLKEVRLWFFYFEYTQKHSEETRRKLPDSFVAKIRTVHAGNPEYLLALAQFPGFQPQTISGNDDDYVEWPAHPKSSAVWAKMLRMNSLTQFSCSNFTTRDLLLGLPANLESVDLLSTSVSGLDDQDCALMASILSSHKCRIDLEIYFDEYPTHLGAAGLRRWASEISFWANADCADVTLQDDSDAERKRTMALELITEIEDHIDDIGLA
jgi:hypothetical protein